MNGFEKGQVLLKYLSKNYYIDDDRYLTRYRDIHEWGCDIAESLVTIFSFGEEFCSHIFRDWAYKNGITVDTWHSAYNGVIGATVMGGFHGIDAVAELEAIMVQEMSREIDREILRGLFNENTNTRRNEGVMFTINDGRNG